MTQIIIEMPTWVWNLVCGVVIGWLTIKLIDSLITMRKVYYEHKANKQMKKALDNLTAALKREDITNG